MTLKTDINNYTQSIMGKHNSRKTFSTVTLKPTFSRLRAFAAIVTQPDFETCWWLQGARQWNHRLNGSSSPVLTATCLSYGSLCNFIFFPNRPGGHTPRPILTQNGSNEVDSQTHVPFGVKIETFWNPWPPDALNHQNLPNFGRDRKFSLDFAFNIGGLTSKHSLIFIGDQ